MELEYVEREPKKVAIRARSLYDRVNDNEKLPCSVPGCETKRSKISSFCQKHRDHNRRQGHPILSSPTPSELEAIIREGMKLLDWYRKRDNKLDTWIDKIGKELSQPVSFVVRPWKIEKNLKRKSKAQIVLAWYEHKRCYDIKSIVLLFLSVELWAYRMDNLCGPSIRHKLVDRAVGMKVKLLASIRQSRKVYSVRIEANPSWTNEPYKRIEEEKTVVEHGKLERSVNKMLGKMIRDAVYEHISPSVIKDYIEDQLMRDLRSCADKG